MVVVGLEDEAAGRVGEGLALGPCGGFLLESIILRNVRHRFIRSN